VIVDDLLFSPITEQASAVRSRRLSPVELTRAYLDRIAKLDGATADGRPLAMQLGGRPFEEATPLRLGGAYGRATAWHRRRPALR